MKTVIIGAEGKMGVWLTEHLAKLGHTVSSFDYRKGDSPSLLKGADTVIVSVPVSKTAEVIRVAQRHMTEGARIVEIASLKTGVHPEMVRAAENDFNALSLHPMFGPRARPGASIVEVEPETHDRLMVHVLSLPYLMNLALGATMGETDLELLKRLSGTSFTLQYTLIQSVAGETTSLVHALLSENRFLEETAEAMISSMRELMGATGEMAEFRALHEAIREPLEADPGHGRALELRQAAYNAVRPLLR